MIDILHEYADIINQLDQPMKMVRIDVISVEASTDFVREFGIGFTESKVSGRESYYWGASESPRDVTEELNTPGGPDHRPEYPGHRWDKGTVVIGGLFENTYAVGETGVACLMNAPGLG